MGMGTPIICSNIPENIYAVGESAILFKKGEPLSLKQRMEEAISNPQHLITLAAKSMKRARQMFSWESVAKKFEEAFLS
jgi:glycosyltransferase involved in cell wall biosynthesis